MTGVQTCAFRSMMNAHRLFSLALGPVALSFTGASGKEDLIRIRQLQMMAGELWPEKWLEERGLEKWAKSWRQLYDHSTKKLEVA